jgi:tripartite-type tricarboxylate transporter receptor subunit TctC
MSAKLGQPIVIENKPEGAAGTVGGRYVASADPDGYTLVMSQVGSLTVAPFLYKLDYDPIKDFAPIGIVAETPEILTINPSLPANTVAEFVAYAKSNPGKLDFASPGVGTLPHLLGEQLQLAAGIKLTHVPYRGAGPAVSDLLGGQVQVMFDSTSVDAAAYPSRPAARACDLERKAHLADSKRADSRRSRLPAAYGIAVDRVARAGRHACADHPKAEHGAE